MTLAEEAVAGTYGSDRMRETLTHPTTGKPQTPHHNPSAIVGFAQQPTGRFDLPVPPSKGTYAVPGPGHYTNLQKTRLSADTLTNGSAPRKPTFGKETQRPDMDKVATRSPGPVYDTLAAAALGQHASPKFSMSPRIWASAPGGCSPRLPQYEPPLGKLPDSFGRQVQGERATAPRVKFPKSQQRPNEVGEAGGGRVFQGKEFAFASRGAASVQVPVYVSHETDGLYRSAKAVNSPRFGFSRESRF